MISLLVPVVGSSIRSQDGLPAVHEVVIVVVVVVVVVVTIAEAFVFFHVSCEQVALLLLGRESSQPRGVSGHAPPNFAGRMLYLAAACGVRTVAVAPMLVPLLLPASTAGQQLKVPVSRIDMIVHPPTDTRHAARSPTHLPGPQHHYSTVLARPRDKKRKCSRACGRASRKSAVASRRTVMTRNVTPLPSAWRYA